MADYSFTLSDGVTIITLSEGSINNAYTIPLLGQNSTNYGESVAQALMWSLENFASNSAPGTGSIDRLVGQQWYDTGTNEMNVWDGSAWRQILTNTGSTVRIDGNVLPATDGLYNLGSNVGPKRWNNGYFQDLTVSDGANTGQLVADVVAVSSTAASPAIRFSTVGYAAPTAPVEGDMYYTASGLFIETSGGTVNLTASAGIPAFTQLTDVNVSPVNGDMLWFNSGDGEWQDTGGALQYSIEGKLTVKSSTTATAGLNIPHGDVPSAPADGDVWTTTAGTAGIYVRINGATVGPLGAGGGGGAVDSFNTRTGAVVSSELDYSDPTTTNGRINVYPRKDTGAPVQTISTTAGWNFNIRPAFNGGSGATSPFTVNSTFPVTNLTSEFLSVSGTPVAGTAFTQRGVNESIGSNWIFSTYVTTPSVRNASSSVSLYYSASAALTTQLHTASDKLSSVAIVGADAVARDAGFATMPPTQVNTSAPVFTKARNQHMLYKDSATTYTYTVDQDATSPAGTMWGLANTADGAININAGAGVTLNWYRGTTITAGNRILSKGGVVTLYKFTDTVYWIYGSGLA